MSAQEMTTLTYMCCELIAGSVLTIILLRTESSLGRMKQIWYFKMVLAGMLVSLVFTVASWLPSMGALGENTMLVRVGVILIYLPLTFSFMNWVNLVATTMKFRWEEKNWWQFITTLPFILLTAIFLSPMISTIVVSAADGHPIVGPGDWLVIPVDTIYLVLGLLIIYEERKQLKRREVRGLIASLVAFVVLLIVGEMLVLLLPGTPLFELMELPAVMMIYTELQSAQVNTDALTGLNNRRRTDEYLKNAMDQVDQDHWVELFLIDIDYFKSINDILGHQAGDQALQVFADAFRRSATLRGTMLGRWGGDEFIAVSVKGKRDPDALISKLTRNLRQLAKERNLGYDIRFSVGYATCASHGVAPAELMKQADHDLYRMKEDNHRDGKSAFETELQTVKERK